MDYKDPEWVAEQLGVDKNTVYRHLASGALPGLQLGRRWLISERRLAEFLDYRTERQTELRKAESRLTGRARRVLDLAISEAKRLNHRGVGQQHILLGTVQVPDCLGAKMLEEMGIKLQALQDTILTFDPPVSEESQDPPELAPLAEEALLRGWQEAQQLGHSWIGVEHFVLGILLVRDGVGFQILSGKLGATVDKARAALFKLLPEHASADYAALKAEHQRRSKKGE